MNKTDLTEIKTLGELKASGYEVLPVKDEIRKNLISKLKGNDTIFEDIVGYEDTVIPACKPFSKKVGIETNQHRHLPSYIHNL